PGNECVARENKTALITTEQMTDRGLQRSAPYMFSAKVSLNRLLRNWIHWADNRNLLQHKEIGLLYYSGNPTPDNETFPVDVRAELTRLHYHLTEEAALDGSEASITVAVARFRNAGV